MEKKITFFQIHHFHRDHNAPCLPLKFCTTIVFDFFWDSCKLNTMVRPNFKENKVYYCLSKSGKCEKSVLDFFPI